MITLSRLNGTVVAINPDLITMIEVTPDTTILLLGGDRLIVRESLDEVVQRVIAFRHAVACSDPSVSQAYPPSSQVLQGVAWMREQASSGEGQSGRPPGRASSRPSGQSSDSHPIVYKK